MNNSFLRGRQGRATVADLQDGESIERHGSGGKPSVQKDAGGACQHLTDMAAAAGIPVNPPVPEPVFAFQNSILYFCVIVRRTADVACWTPCMMKWASALPEIRSWVRTCASACPLAARSSWVVQR